MNTHTFIKIDSLRAKKLNTAMARIPALGLRSTITIYLLIVFSLFILLTEITISKLLAVGLQLNVQHGVTTRPNNASNDIQNRPVTKTPTVQVQRLRQMIRFYLIAGAAIALLLGIWAIDRAFIRPLSKFSQSIEQVTGGDLNAQLSIKGPLEIIDLAVHFNKMTHTVKEQQIELQSRLQALETSNASIKEIQDQLIHAAKIASVGTLAAGVAHEIGNPIAGVLGLLEVLDTETNTTARQKYQQLIKKEIKRIDRIIGGLVAYARPSVQKETSHNCHVATVIAHVKALVTAQKSFDKIEITINIHDDLHVQMSSDDLTQVLVNVLLNAGQSINGAGNITFETKKIEKWRPALAVVMRPAVRIVVTDDGPGIEESHIERIFDPFYTKQPNKEGAGLGLAICQSLCERAGGQITVDGKFKKGARFFITVPSTIVSQ